MTGFLTQKLILQPRTEWNFYGKSDPANAIGSGLVNASAGLRLRYEITRQIAPYIGVEWQHSFGRTGDFVRAWVAVPPRRAGWRA
jgi:copper resistance protein B